MKARERGREGEKKRRRKAMGEGGRGGRGRGGRRGKVKVKKERGGGKEGRDDLEERGDKTRMEKRREKMKGKVMIMRGGKVRTGGRV